MAENTGSPRSPGSPAGKKSIKLKVQEAVQEDVNKGIVRIDSPLMREIDIRPGDVVVLQGERSTVAIADRAYPGDIGLNIIRMDGLARRNAKTGIGQMVQVNKAEIKEAKKLVIAPAQKGILVRASPVLFKQSLLGRAVVKGDIISPGGAGRRRSTMSQSPLFNDIFSMLEESQFANFGFGDLKFIVVDTTPKDAVIISDLTQIEVKPEAVELKEEERMLDVSYEDIGGLEEEIKKIREMVELPLKHPEIFERLGIDAPKGVLLHGPPGTGKTLLAKAVANETNSNFLLINGPEIMSKYYGQSEENLRKKFEDAEKNAPSIIFIDEVDAIAAKREEVHGEVERRVVAQLLATMDGLKSRGKVVVIAATNIPNQLDPALRRPGRFDREVEIGIPGKPGRMDILKIHTRNMPLCNEEHVLADYKNMGEAELVLLTKVFSNLRQKMSVDKAIQEALKENGEEQKADKAQVDKLKKVVRSIRADDRLVNLREIADITHGFVGADLSALAKEAAMIVLRRVLPEMSLKSEEAIPDTVLQKLLITQRDFYEALKIVRPSALREVSIEAPNVRWDDIGGLGDVKQELIEAVEWPMKYPAIFKRMGVKPPCGVLLYGPAGTGKTMVAKAVATEGSANFILVNGPELISKWVGESEKGIRRVFHKARQASPAVIFFDEIDSIAPRRGASSDNKVSERVVNQLLTEMDGLEDMKDVVVIAATNRPDIVDTGLLRPGRFDRIIHVPIPDKASRVQIFELHTKEMPLAVGMKEKEHNNSTDEKKKGKRNEAKLRKDFINKLAEETEGYTGADIEAVCREAAILALRESDMKAKEVKLEHFSRAVETVRPSVTQDIIEAYKEFESYFRKAKGREMQAEKPSYMG